MHSSVVSLLAGLAFFVSAVPASALHLYAESGQSQSGGIWRFPIVNRLPAAHPDFVYDCTIIYCGGRSMTVAPSGTVYLSTGEIYAYRHDRRRPSRNIRIPQPPSCQGYYASAYGIAASPRNDIAVGMVQIGYAQLSPNFTVLPNREPANCQGVLFYGPHESGYAQPLGFIALNSTSTYLAWSSTGDLFVIDTDGLDVLQFRNPVNNPTLVARYLTGYCNSNGGAVDERGYFYVYESCFGSPPDNIEVFHVGSTYPVRDIQLPFEDNPYYGRMNIAVADGYVYVPNQPHSRVDLFRANSNGPQRPVYSVRLPGPAGPLAIGP